jgi:signal transduction histidine kinase
VKAREEFISIASHELRTPLTSLKLRIDFLSRVIEKGNIPPEIVQKLNPILRELKPDLTKFSTLVETLLDISKIGSDKLLLHSTKCDVTETLLSEVNRFKEIFSSKNIPFFTTIEENMKGHCDSVRIQQVISNLLTNAMKFSKNNPVHLTAGKRGDLLVIEVIDKGIGISQEDMQRIFSPFERAVSDKNFGGLGLGLYISKQIIESHGGRILVEGQLDVGTKFSVELPILQPTS